MPTVCELITQLNGIIDLYNKLGDWIYNDFWADFRAKLLKYAQEVAKDLPKD